MYDVKSIKTFIRLYCEACSSASIFGCCPVRRFIRKVFAILVTTEKYWHHTVRPSLLGRARGADSDTGRPSRQLPDDRSPEWRGQHLR
jgi:hypothetical protein